jgi:hypothetical protein
MGAVLLAHAPTEHRGYVGDLELDEVIEPVQPAGERFPAAGPLVQCRHRFAHRPDASGFRRSFGSAVRMTTTPRGRALGGCLSDIALLETPGHNRLLEAAKVKLALSPERAWKVVAGGGA